LGSKHERHARSKEWDTPPARSAEVRAAAVADQGEPVKRTPARKDTARWCGGHTGREHAPHLMTPAETTGWRQRACGWVTTWDRRERDYKIAWRCGHWVRCGQCGRTLRDIGSLELTECKTYPGTKVQRAAAEADLADYRVRRAKWARRRLVINGPQGYRRSR